jgi:hypothetical protein
LQIGRSCRYCNTHGGCVVLPVLRYVQVFTQSCLGCRHGSCRQCGKMTHRSTAEVTEYLAMASDYPFEQFPALHFPGYSL